MVERVKDIVLKAARLIDSSIYDLDENHTWTQIKVHNIPLEHYFWRGSLGQLKEEIHAENSGIIIPGPVRWIKSVKTIGDELDKGAVKHSSIVLNIKDKVAVQKMLKHGIRIAGKSHQVKSMYARDWIANATCVTNGGIHRTSVPKQNPHVESVLRNMVHQHTYVGLVDAHPNEG
jgi:hypothetical protein